jgi:hypothetical protein
MRLAQYEKYELRAGYLSRWDYMSKDVEQMSSEGIEQSIKKGYEVGNEWLKRDVNQNCQEHSFLKNGKIVLARKKSLIVSNVRNL